METNTAKWWTTKVLLTLLALATVRPAATAAGPDSSVAGLAADSAAAFGTTPADSLMPRPLAADSMAPCTADTAGADAVIAALRQSPLSPHAAIAEEDAGLHYLLRLDGAPPDDVLRRAAEERGIRLAMLSDYYQSPREAPQHVLVVNYTGIDTEKLPTALARLAELWPS